MAKLFGTQYRLTRIDSIWPLEKEDRESTSTLAEFKVREYVLRILCDKPFLLFNEETIRNQVVGILEVSSHIKLLQETERWRMGQKPDPLKESEYTPAKLRKQIQLGLTWLPLRDYFEKSWFLVKHLKSLLVKLLHEDVLAFAKKNPSDADFLGNRLRIVRDSLGMGEIEEELLLYAYLQATNKSVNALHHVLKSRYGLTLENREDDICITHHHIKPETFSVILGHPKGEIAAVLAKDSPLMRFEILDREFDPASEIIDFLESRKDVSFLERYFRINSGPALSLESHSIAQEDRELLTALLRAHEGKCPLNILLYGLEGTGKTELARSLGAATGRQVLEVAASHQEARREDRIALKDSVIRYSLRALQLSALHAQGKRCVLVMDEADTFLNMGEKGKINQLMEEISVPVIWISNDISLVERSTLRRFDYSIAFRKLGDGQRKKLWENILVKHGAEHLLSKETLDDFAHRYPTTAGGVELAVRNAKAVSVIESEPPSSQIMKRVLQAHGKLLGFEEEASDKASRAPHYSLEGLNIRGDVKNILATVRAFQRRLKDHDPSQGPCNLTLLLYGPPGTGKTEFARFLARKLDRPLLLKRASDLFGKWVGENEKNIRDAFGEAQAESAILFLDEADSFLQNRETATRSWEITHVNEMLTRMENFTGLLICATNFQSTLDPASRRRFHLKLEFGHLQEEGAMHFWHVFFTDKTACEPDRAFFGELCSLSLLSPGDFKAVYERLRYFSKDELTPERILGELRQEISFKDSRAGRHIGF